MLSTHEFISTKILPPQKNVKIVQRSRLITDFNENHKLVVISAPTGYGKTVLLSQLMSVASYPIAWYQLDTYDNDLTMFVQYFIAAIAKHIPQFGVQTWNYIVKSGDISKDIRSVATFLVNELQARATEGLIFVFDDYHLIRELSIHKLIEEIIQYLPKGIQFIIASRHALPFPMTRLRLHNLVYEINADQLQFNKEEVKQFLQIHQESAASDDFAEQCLSETGGWAAALTFLQFPTADRKPAEQPLFSRWKNREIMYRYFAEELFQQLPEKVQAFLTKTSVLEALDPEICNVLAECTDSFTILEDLLRQNIFIMKSNVATYRYHHLFREFLLEHLGNQKTFLLQRAAEYYSLHGYYTQAVEYYILANAYDSAIKNIEKSALKMIRSCNWQTFRRWLRMIPSSYKNKSPHMLLLQGVVDNYNGILIGAVSKIEEAEQQFMKLQQGRYLLMSRFQKAIVFRREGKIQESISVLNTAINGATDFSIEEWYDIILEKVNTLMWIGALQDAEEALQDGLQLAKHQDQPQLIAYFTEHLGAVHYAKGEYHKAIEHYKNANEIYSQVQNLLSQFEMERYSQRTTLAKIYRDWGELNTALDLITEVITTKEAYGLIDDLPRAYHEAALIYNDTGNITKAEEYFEKAYQLYERIERKDFQWAWHLALYGKILIDNGKTIYGEKLIAKAIAAAKENSEFNLAICEFIGCYTFISAGEIEKAIQAVEHALQVATRVGAKNLIAQCCWALSNIFMAIGMRQKAEHFAQNCFSLAAKENYLQIFLSYPSTSIPIIQLGMEMGIEKKFIDNIVLRMGENARNMLSELISSNNRSIQKRAKNLLDKIQLNVGTKSNFLEVYAFGNLKVFAENKTLQIEWKTMKAAELFMYFIKNMNQFRSRDLILEDLWPEMDPEITSKRLHTYIYQIRKSLESIGFEEIFIYKNKGYYINCARIRCDANEFLKLLQIADNEKTDDIKISKLEEAVHLYTGDYIQDSYSQWILEERNRLSLLLIKARKELANLYIAKKKYGSAEKHLLAILDRDPLYKEVHDTLIGVYHKSGNTAAAKFQNQKYINAVKMSFE